MISDSVENIITVVNGLFPVYIIILSGLLAVYSKILSPESVSYFSHFMFHFTLPAILFHDVARADISIKGMRWDIITSTLVGSMIIWILVVFVCLIYYRKSIHAFGKAGILSLCCTFSSSVFTAYPIVKYMDERAVQNASGKNVPEYAIYCIICFVIWNITIVPMSILLCETYVDKRKRDENPDYKSKLSIARYIRAALRSSLNPVTIPVFLGLIVWGMRSFIDWSNVPVIPHVALVISNWTSIIGRATTGTALFCIGMSMYGKTIVGESLTGTLLLIGVKQIIVPIVVLLFFKLYHLAFSMDPETDFRTNSSIYLINMVPPAQVTYLLSMRYKSVSLPDVSSCLIFGGLINFGLIYVSMSFLSMEISDIWSPRLINEQLQSLLGQTSIFIGVISILCCIWTFLPSLFNKKYQNSLRRLVAGLCVAQSGTSLLFGIGSIIISLMTNYHGNVEDLSWLCVSQGFLLQLFALTAMTYFFLISFHILLKFIIGLSVPFYVETMYHFSAWGMGIFSASIPMFLTFSDQSLGYGRLLTWCWISNLPLQFALYYAPFVLFGIFSIITIILIRVSFFRSTKSDLYSERNLHTVGSEDQIVITPFESTTLPLKFNKMRMDILWKSIVFSLVFDVTWGWGLLNRLSQMILGGGKQIFFFQFFHVLFSCGQGIGTMLVFGTGKGILNDYEIWIKSAMKNVRHFGQKLQLQLFGNQRFGFGIARGRKATKTDDEKTEDEKTDDERSQYDDNDATERDADDMSDMSIDGIDDKTEKRRSKRYSRRMENNTMISNIFKNADGDDEDKEDPYLFSPQMLRKLSVMHSENPRASMQQKSGKRYTSHTNSAMRHSFIDTTHYTTEMDESSLHSNSGRNRTVSTNLGPGSYVPPYLSTRDDSVPSSLSSTPTSSIQIPTESKSSEDEELSSQDSRRSSIRVTFFGQGARSLVEGEMKRHSRYYDLTSSKEFLPDDPANQENKQDK